MYNACSVFAVFLCDPFLTSFHLFLSSLLLLLLIPSYFFTPLISMSKSVFIFLCFIVNLPPIVTLLNFVIHFLFLLSLTHCFWVLQDIEETMNTALNELRELERQSSAKHAPDVVLDTLEQRQTSGSSGGGPTPASSSESLSPIHGVMLRSTANTEPPIRRSTSSSSDAMSTFKPLVAPRMGVQLKPPALRPKPMVLPKTSQAPQPPAASAQDPLDKSCTM